MKGTISRGIVVSLLIFALFAPLSAQEENFAPAEGDYYTVFYEGRPVEAEQLAARLDAYARLFEEYLHFERAALPARLKVKIFASQAGYADYLRESIGEPKDSFVFLQYSDPQRSELVGYNSGTGFERGLIHHAYIQYLKTFIPYPPLWLQKGMAIYLEKSRYIPEEERVEYRENLDWLKSLKTYVALDTEMIPVSILLTMDVEAANRQIESFYAQSWGLVHFLLNSERKEYNRILWDSLSALRSDATRPENESSVIDEGFAWVNKDQFLTRFEAYIDGLKTFPELVEEGIAAYGRGEYRSASELFNRAIELRKDHYIPYYYLGLINYGQRDFTMSDYFYSQALERGGARSLILYAKGITAYSAEDSESAAEYLREVVSQDPTGYGSKAQELLTRIEAESGETSSAPEGAEESEEETAEESPVPAEPEESQESMPADGA